MMNKFLIALTLTVSTGLFAVPDNLGGICNCDPDPNIGCLDCDSCTPVGDPATEYVDCELIDTEEDLEDTEEEIDSDIDNEAEDFDENGILGAVEGTYADYEEVYIIDEETPYTNEAEMIPSWCD
jgi:hypothetical protein